MQPKEKNYNISLLRMMSTIVIVVFHVLLKLSPGNGKTFFPFYIGVPVFLFISGYLYASKKPADIKSFYTSNLLKILLPTIVFLAIYCASLGIYSLCTGIPFVSFFHDFSGGGTAFYQLETFGLSPQS